MNGITYYRLKSDYPGDYTKNCALNGTEVDNNFYVLEGRDVKSIAVKDKDIVVTLLNGDTLKAIDALDFVKPEDVKTSVVNVKFDKLNGILELTLADGTIQHIEGFATNENTDFSVATDNTLCGDGLRNAPLGVAPSARTGQFKTVKSLVDIASGASLPKCGNIIGDRYVTCEDISDYGYLYDYTAVKEIACELKNTGWRIPTKSDWDEMLNAIEPCDCNRTHDKSDRNKVLGKWAGKLLKSKTMWVNCGCECDDCGCECDGCKHKHNCGCDDGCTCGKDTCFDYTDDPCIGTKECSQSCKCEDNCCGEHKGLDAYGFRVTPAGYADDGCNYGYFKERSAFWTATTNNDNSKAYIKRFQFNKDGVYQDVIASSYHLSLRLVKDYDGKNYFDTEEIMDMEYPTLLLPSTTKGKMIWTAANFACGNASFSPMLPNNGQSLTYTRHYFINEWDGFKWVRNEMKQGDTVTIEKAPKGKKMVEYRVVGNDFISVNEMIYNDVLADVNVVIDEKEQKLTDRIELVEKSVETETEDRKAADEKLQESVDFLVKKTDKTNEDLATVNTNLVTAVNKINTDIATVNQNLVDAINTINGGIATEIQERKDTDAALDERVTENKNSIDALIEKTDKTNEELGKTNQTLSDFGEETNKAIDMLNTAIGTVNQNLVDAINTINGGIATEIQERKDADAAEAKTREETDNALAEESKRINSELEKTNQVLTDFAGETKTAIDTLNANIGQVNDNLVKSINTINGAISAEVQERKDNDDEIRGTILTSEGTEFDSENGILTLKSKDGTNDMTVQFNFNFGEF